MTSVRTVLLIGSLAACGGAAKPVHYESALRARAAFDLQCPEPQLTVTKLGDRNTAGVEGCGRRGTYYNDDNDQWVLNTPTGTPEAQMQPNETSRPSPSGPKQIAP
jgi:hypothetical protein